MQKPNAKPPPPEGHKSLSSAPRCSKWGLDEGDLDLIRWMLEKTPAERLRYAEGFATSVEILKNGRRV